MAGKEGSDAEPKIRTKNRTGHRAMRAAVSDAFDAGLWMVFEAPKLFFAEIG